MKIATWNVNSLNVRLGHVLEWLDAANPDILVLQEIKQVTEAFPTESFTDVGYRAVASGQKTYNGVAVISKAEPTDHVTDFPGFEDPQRRILASTIDDVRV
ncbi:MAG: endonuclease/exonuclease/phosphatase family protein, partial [Pseudomonadota bacterium]|nr:endonuclease/exonuclease/phosphatase family protein [Pseudomonadota bacterium]